MLDLQQGVDRNNLSSFRRVYQRSSKSTGSRTEFNFWDEKRTKKYDNLADLESSQIEFQTATDDYSAYSPPFWASTRHEASTLLPKNHHYSFRSPTSRLQVITDSRRELMKMVQDMPDQSNYELSLKDIVDDRTSMQEVQQDVEKKIEREKNISYKRRQMSRSESMDSGVFLLKMFMPACLCSKKKPAALGNRKKVSRMPSFDESEKPVDKEWWGVRFLISRHNKTSCSSSSSSGSTSCISSRNADSSFTPSCCSSDNLCRSRRQRGCLF